jgi:hypothetical protein
MSVRLHADVLTWLSFFRRGEIMLLYLLAFVGGVLTIAFGFGAGKNGQPIKFRVRIDGIAPGGMAW